MGYRTLEINVRSAKHLNNVNFITKMDAYVQVSIAGDSNSSSSQKTPVDREGNTNPNWNFPMNFIINDSPVSLNLIFVLRCDRALGDKDIGEVTVPITDLLGPAGEDKPQFVTYQVRMPSGKPKGELNFSYKWGDKVSAAPKLEDPVTAAYQIPPGPLEDPVTAYPTVPGPSNTAYPLHPGPAPVYPYHPPPPPPPPPAAGYGYDNYPPPAPAGYGYPPPPPPHQGGYEYPPPPPPPPAGYGYPPPAPAGYGYQQPPPPGYGGYGYGYPPPPQPGYGYPPVQQGHQSNNSGLGLGLGAGLIGGAVGGLLIGDMLDDGFDCGF